MLILWVRNYSQFYTENFVSKPVVTSEARRLHFCSSLHCTNIHTFYEERRVTWVSAARQCDKYQKFIETDLVQVRQFAAMHYKYPIISMSSRKKAETSGSD